MTIKKITIYDAYPELSEFWVALRYAKSANKTAYELVCAASRASHTGIIIVF
jgi:hypothetical protein